MDFLSSSTHWGQRQFHALFLSVYATNLPTWTCITTPETSRFLTHDLIENNTTERRFMIALGSAAQRLTREPAVQSCVLSWMTVSPNKARWCALFPQQTVEESQASQLGGFSATTDASQLLLQLRVQLQRAWPHLNALALLYTWCHKLWCSNRNDALFIPRSLLIRPFLQTPRERTVLASRLEQAPLKGNQSAAKTPVLLLFLPNARFLNVVFKGLKWTKRTLRALLFCFNVLVRTLSLLSQI